MRSIFKYFSLTIFFVLLLVYTFNDYLNSGNSGFDDSNRGSVYLYLILIVVYFILYLVFNRPRFSQSMTVIKSMIVLTIWIVLCNLVNNRLGWIMYVHLFMAIWWICAYFFFYAYCRLNPDSLSYITSFFSVMLMLYIYFSFEAQTRIQMDKDMDHVVLNYAYNVLAFIPIILLIKKRTIRFVFLGLATVALFLSFKRGPLVILPVMYVAYQVALPKSKGNAIRLLFRFAIAIFFFWVLFSYVDSVSGGFLSSRFSKSELQYGSSRDEMWSIAINDIVDRDFLTLLVGKGSGSSIELLTSGVHNEWLEFLFTFGIIGVFLYLSFGISLLIKYFKMRKRESEYAPIMGVLVAFFWMVGMFSGFYFVHSSFYFFAMMGIIDAFDSKTKPQNVAFAVK